MMILKHVCETWERRKGSCVLLPISRAKYFVYEKVFQNKLNVKKCEVKSFVLGTLYIYICC
jgi:hypothetical protein